MSIFRQIDGRALGVPFFFVLLWSTGFLGAKYGAPYSEPMTFLTIRFLIVLAILVCLIPFLRPQWPTSAIAFHSVVVGMLMHGIYLGGVFWAIDRGMPANISVMIIGLQPILTALFGWGVLGEKLRLAHWIGLALGLFGLFLVINGKTSGLAHQGLSVETIGACILAVFAIALATVYQKRFATSADLISGGIYQYIGGTLVTLPYAFLLEEMVIEWTGHFIFALAWLVLVLSIGAISLLMILIRRGLVSNIAALFYLVPVSTAIMSWALFGERLSSIQIVGMILISVAVFITSANIKALRAKNDRVKT